MPATVYTICSELFLKVKISEFWKYQCQIFHDVCVKANQQWLKWRIHFQMWRVQGIFMWKFYVHAHSHAKIYQVESVNVKIVLYISNISSVIPAVTVGTDSLGKIGCQIMLCLIFSHIFSIDTPMSMSVASSNHLVNSLSVICNPKWISFVNLWNI